MVRIRPGVVEVTMDVGVSMNADPPQVVDAPGGLYPLQARAFEMDEYRLMSGWPVSVPKYDIRARTLVSATGEKFADRLDPISVKTGALNRWVADDTLYDETALTWHPLQDGTDRPVWTTSSNYAPIFIPEYEYRVKDERFYHSALNFDSDTRKHMWCDFTSTIGGSSGYTVIMVMSPNSVYGNDIDVPYNGIWSPGKPSPGTPTFADPLQAHWMAVTIQGNYLYLETESTGRTRGISVAPSLGSTAPLYLAMVFDRPEVTFYAGDGPSSIRVKTLPTGTTDPVPLDGRITLGRTVGDVLHTADMALFDLGIYPNRLQASEVASEFSLLSQAYGGDG